MWCHVPVSTQPKLCAVQGSAEVESPEKSDRGKMTRKSFLGRDLSLSSARPFCRCPREMRLQTRAKPGWNIM